MSSKFSESTLGRSLRLLTKIEKQKVIGVIAIQIILGLLDLVYNKLEANRKKDRSFLKNSIDNALIDILELKKFILENAPNDDVKESLLVSLEELTQRR